MSPKVWLPVIVVFLVVLLFAGLRLITAPPPQEVAHGPATLADPNLARAILQHLMGPKSDEEN